MASTERQSSEVRGPCSGQVRDSRRRQGIEVALLTGSSPRRYIRKILLFQPRYTRLWNRLTDCYILLHQRGLQGFHHMRASATHEEAKAELEAILSSGLFAHAPSLAQFLSYVGSKCLEGQGSQIKEYSIAVEALRRTPDFDQKRDSIVRVEAHRLRKRLRQYYEAAGASHSIQIVIPAGQYVPQFVLQEDAQAAIVQAPEPDDDIELIDRPLNVQLAAVPEKTATRRLVAPGKLLVWLGAAAAVLASILTVWRLAPQLRLVSPVA